MEHSDQSRIWNGVLAQAWVRHAERFDASLDPLGHAAMRRLDLQPGERVLDVGCGVGATTIEIAGIVSPGEVVGIDLSGPMIDAARRRLPSHGSSNITFVEADVGHAELRSEFDVVFSRLGVMFFPDPVSSFAAIRAALRPGGRLGFVCFQEPQANPFIVLPILTAADHLELPPLPGPGEPSPFSLADNDLTIALLSSVGFAEVAIEAGPDEVVFDLVDDGIRGVAMRMLEQNPMTSERLLAADAAQREAALSAVVEALTPFCVDDQVRLGAGTWIVSASNPG